MKRFIGLLLMVSGMLLGSYAAAAGTGAKPGLKLPEIKQEEIAALVARMEPYLKSLEANGANAFAAPAPALYYLEAHAVISSQYPTYEFLGQYQYLTNQDHGGAEMYIVTAELGYGNIPVARMNGAYLTEVQKQSIVNSAGTIVGWYRWWNASGQQSGQFTYQNTSMNSPFNTMNDWINIK